MSQFAGFAHANAIYDAHADALLSIDAVTNLTNAGNLSAFLVDGNVYLENEGSSQYGKGILAPYQNAFGDALQFSITLLPGEFGRLTLNVLALGNSESKAEPVPEPAAVYLLTIGLSGLTNWRHRRRPALV